jgi:hypothetical protein
MDNVLVDDTVLLKSKVELKDRKGASRKAGSIRVSAFCESLHTDDLVAFCPRRQHSNYHKALLLTSIKMTKRTKSMTSVEPLLHPMLTNPQRSVLPESTVLGQ